MSQAINEHIEKKRKQIRRAQTNQLFMAKRQLMTPIPKDLAIQTLMPQLSVLRRYIYNEEDLQQVRQSLNKIHHVVINYDSIRVLMERVEFQECQIIINKIGASFNETSWIDLILIFLKDFDDDSQMSEECSIILSKCVQSLKPYCSQKQGTSVQNCYTRQLKKLLQSYPYHLLIQGTIQTIQNSLDLIYNLMLGSPDSSSVYFLVSKVRPSLVSLLNTLSQNQFMFNVPSLQNSFIYTSISLLYFMSRYNYTTFDHSQYKTLVNRTAKLVVDRLLGSQDQNQFLMFCYFVRLMCQVKEYTMSEQQFGMIQNLLEGQQSHLHKEYLIVLKTILYHYTMLIQPYHVRTLCLRLFNPEQVSSQELTLKTIILDILLTQIANNGGKFPSQDMEIFISCWGQHTQVDRLIRLIEALEKSEHEEKALNNVFELLVRLATDSPQFLEKFVSFLEGELDCLLCYPELFKLLELQGFTIKSNSSI